MDQTERPTTSNETETPSSTNTFSSNFSINVPGSAPAGIYAVNITAAANGKTYCCSYTLAVTNVEIQVSGTISIDSSNNTFPTQIQFLAHTPTYTDSTFSASVHLNVGILFTGVVTKGTFIISLPNQQTYTVIIKWESISPTGVGSFGTQFYGTLLVNCSRGVTSMTEEYSI